jgi:hypothetical protein
MFKVFNIFFRQVQIQYGNEQGKRAGSRVETVRNENKWFDCCHSFG